MSASSTACTTKAFVVDSKVVALGSQNWSSDGVLRNRDASSCDRERDGCRVLRGDIPARLDPHRQAKPPRLGHYGLERTHFPSQNLAVDSRGVEGRGPRGADAQEERILRTYLGSAQFDTIHTLAVQGDVTRGGAASLGKVVVLHGIMGGELNTIEGDSQNLLWVQILRLIQGQFGKLALDAQGASEIDVRASGMYMRFYGSQLARLSQQWTVRPFYFDWRRDIRLAADELHTSINTWFGPDEPVHLVGHSMGGLVARSYIVKHKDRWDKGGRLIMLGTPNYGSFAIPRLLFGTNDILAIVSKIDFAHDARDLLNTAKTFTGAYQMLPVLNHLPGPRRPLQGRHLFGSAHRPASA